MNQNTLTELEQKILTKAYALLNKKEYSTYLLTNKIYQFLINKQLFIEQKNNYKEIINKQLEKLKLKNHLSDQRFTESFVIYQQNRNKGINYIKYQLINHAGIDEMLIDKYCSINKNEELARLTIKFNKKFKPPFKCEDKGKINNYLLSQGFEQQLIYEFIKSQIKS